MRNFLSLGVLLLLFNCQSASEEITQTDHPLAAKIDSFVLAQKAAFELPGLAIGVIQDGEVIYAKGHGVQGLDTQEPLDLQSIFHMASVSKPVVATAVVQLVEAGKIDLDERLITYLPYFKMADERYKDITIRQMLVHTSGIPDVEDYEWENPQLDDGAAERYSKSFGDMELDFEPGSEFSYSNAAFDLLADVIAKTSGILFEDYMKANIFEPLGMKNTTFFKPEVPEAIATKAHVVGPDLQLKVWEHYPYNRIHAPSSTLNSNVEDMLQWAKANLSRGKLNGKEIYSEQGYQMLTTGQYPLGEQDSVCLSWFTRKVDGNKLLGHSGGDEGFSTYFGFVPSTQSAVVVMANADVFWPDYLVNSILKRLEGVNPWRQPINYELKNLILTEGIDAVKAFYYDKKENEPDKYLFRLGFLDDLGYQCIDRGHYQEALDLFKFMVELEPEDSGWPDSVADAYRAMGNNEKAIEWYQKALSIDPEQGFSIQKLKELQGD
ncbi:MAG: serine hydrolase [Bacteroidota bacterium]